MDDDERGVRFIPSEQLPVVNQRTPVGKVYRQLGLKRGSNFIVRMSSAEQFFIRGSRFASTILRPSEEGLDREALMMPVGDLLRRRDLSELVFPVSPVVVEAAEPRGSLLNPQLEILEVTRNGVRIGWYVPREALGDAATSRTVWICAIGHRNLDPDQGFCSHCHNKLVSTEEES